MGSNESLQRLDEAERELVRGTPESLAACIVSCRAAVLAAAAPDLDPQTRGKDHLFKAFERLATNPPVQPRTLKELKALAENHYNLASVGGKAHGGKPAPEIAAFVVSMSRALCTLLGDPGPATHYKLSQGSYLYFDSARVALAQSMRLSGHDRLSRQLRAAKNNAAVPPPELAAHEERLQLITSYTMTVFEQVWLLQNAFPAQDLGGEFFQGLPTMGAPPDIRADGFVRVTRAASHRLSGWAEFGYRDAWAPVRIICDSYDGPQGRGYVCHTEFSAGDRIYRMSHNWGPEESRGGLRWTSSPAAPFPGEAGQGLSVKK